MSELIKELFLREALPAGPIDMAALRAAFGRLMDEAAHRVTLEGRDLDDTICDRLAELAYDGDPRRVRVECRSTLDAGPLREDFRRLHMAESGEPGRSSEILLHAAWLRIQIFAGDAGGTA